MTVVLAGLLVMSIGTVSKANSAPLPYNVTQYSYDDYYDNVSSFGDKDTDSAMYVYCGSSTSQFRVSALGSAGSGYSDCSGGYRYFINEGECVDEMINFINENGYHWAGILGEYMFEEYFHASGHFIPDI